MTVLIISATSAEIAPLAKHIAASWEQRSEAVYTKGEHELELLITGVGMVAATYALTKRIHLSRPDFLIQAGICGSFDQNLELGQVVFVTSEQFGDLGAEDHYNFLDVFDLGLAEGKHFPFQNERLLTPLSTFQEHITLPTVTGLTINTTSGTSFTATARSEKYNCTVEGMEGAALHYVCLQENIPFAQIRSISNYVEARDRSKWKIEDAIDSLNKWLISYVESL